ncbi:patatin-like phospholipase family protein [Laceyella sacchari]|jgi:NTE family protein|uniref:Patatin-like phospholipase family protein n=1 Tax=Laceyella sacchari TaxID=37482 RepID=A0ABY5TZ05_LACSH|nr:patatin-like phospholipase family protein [Laceyella sacchari]TCW37476.1 NTE family protein [Laceyella sacchari]UWE02641.1 patatin-like phospholipase family protein [Laceyella sacchari]
MARPKIGLALSSGGARGMAHLGVVKVLKEAGIDVQYVAGSSMGSVVSVMVANRLNLDLCEKLVSGLRVKHWLDLTVPKMGLVMGEKVQELIRLLAHRKRIEELPIPARIVATDLVKGEPVVFKEGPIDVAVRASIAIPGIFEPVRIGDQILVDGGVIDRIPISVVREMGADFVIAVDVIPRVNKAKIKNIFDVIAQTLVIMEKEITSQRWPMADFLIHPDVADISPTAFNRMDECVKRGEREARKVLPQLLALIENWQGEKSRDELESV